MAGDLSSRSRTIFVAVVSFLLVMNLVVLASAYPETKVIDSGCCGNRLLAKDFSAFYIGAWRLFNDPAQVYNASYVSDGEFQVLPQPEGFKYLPSFLLLVSPLLLLPYQSALKAFDLFQFLLLPLIAVLIYELTKDKGLTAGVVVAFATLLLPLPTPQWGISAAYYWQWAEGQSKVLETFLLLLSFVLGRSARPRLSGIVLGIAAFDPRFALISLPLFIMYNRSKLSSAFAWGIGTLILTNVTLLIPGTGLGFIGMLLRTGLTTPFYYYYSLIPIFAVVSLTIFNLSEIASTLRGHNSSTRPTPQQ